MIQIKDFHGKVIKEIAGAYLRGADLRDANLGGAKLSWTSHHLISEILVRRAGNDTDKIALAGIVRIKTDWCWEHYEKLEHPAKAWAIAELAKWVKDGDEAPQFIKEASTALREV